MMDLAGPLTADRVALVMQGQVAPLMMVLVVQHIVGRVGQCHVRLVDELMMVPVGQHTADRAALVMQDQVGHAIQDQAEVGGRARQFAANSERNGIKFSDAVFNLSPQISYQTRGSIMKKSIGTSALLGALCLTVMPFAPAYAANWVYVTTDKDNTGFYYDSDTIQRSGNQVTVWTMYDHSRDKTVKMRESKVLIRYGCAERTLTTLQETTYYPNGTMNTVIVKPYEQEEIAIPPSTVAEKMLEAVCQ
jgi:hypothetical protein